jgi:hypothetical protein
MRIDNTSCTVFNVILWLQKCNVILFNFFLFLESETETALFGETSDVIDFHRRYWLDIGIHRKFLLSTAVSLMIRFSNTAYVQYCILISITQRETANSFHLILLLFPQTCLDEKNIWTRVRCPQHVISENLLPDFPRSFRDFLSVFP